MFNDICVFGMYFSIHCNNSFFSVGSFNGGGLLWSVSCKGGGGGFFKDGYLKGWNGNPTKKPFLVTCLFSIIRACNLQWAFDLR